MPDQVLGPFQRLAEGDPTGHVDATGLSGHFGLVLPPLEDIKRRFGEIVAQVRSSSELVVRPAREIAEGNSNLARRTEHQASTLEETASGMEQLSPPQIRGEHQWVPRYRRDSGSSRPG
jgi:methyl-accepting chemotaxis protein